MNLFGIMAIIMGIVQQAVPIVMGLAVLYFLWGAKKYITSKDGESQTEARGMIVHGIIILFVMVSIWGLVNIIVVTFGIGPTALPTQSINIDGGSNYGGSGPDSSRRIFCWGRNC